MGECVAATIIEPRSLLREALISLMTSHSYHVVGAVASTSDIDNSMLVADTPKLVILGALPADEATTAAGSIRKLWPGTKIILLFEHASSADFQKLLVSEIDGCIPLSASPDTLIGTLQQIVAADLKILVLKTATCSPMPGTAYRQELDLGTNNLAPGGEVGTGATDGAISIRIPHGLSEREEQILRGLVKGHSNKLIARMCGSTEATVKVHVKSILRKIRVANRTQAAIWAIEQGYGADGLEGQVATDTAAQRAAKHRRAEANLSTAIGIGAD
jgi:two-component system nitrate/nitrite response regulator NarL